MECKAQYQHLLPGQQPHSNTLGADGTFSVPSGTGIGISSVGLSTNATFLTIANSPLTSNGTITANLTTGLTQNYVLATPDGTSGVVGLRALVAADIPNLATTKLTSGVLALARGGNFFGALGDLIYGGVAAAPTVLSGNIQATRQFLGQTGTGSVSAAPAWASIAVTDLPSIPNTQLTNSSITIDGDGVLLSATAPGSVALGATGYHCITYAVCKLGIRRTNIWFRSKANFPILSDK